MGRNANTMMNGMMGCGAAALLWLLFVGLLVVGIVVLVRTLTDRGTGSGRSASSALEILEERFARGEIDLEEFEERRRALRA